MKEAAFQKFSISIPAATIALILSSMPGFAQQPKPQAIPNMGQQITPLAPQGSQFAPLDPELSYDPAFLGGQGWLAGQAVTTVVSPDHKTLLVLTSGYNRVYNTNIVPPPTLPPWYVPGLDRVRVHLRHFDAGAGQEAGTADPEYLQRDCLRSIGRGFLRGRRPE